MEENKNKEQSAEEHFKESFKNAVESTGRNVYVDEDGFLVIQVPYRARRKPSDKGE